MNATRVPASKLGGLSTTELIAQYELAIGSRNGGMPNGRMQQDRVNRICDLVLARAEVGDLAADAWLREA